MAGPLQRLVAELARLPGIGPKTAARLAHHLLRVSADQARELAAAILEVKEKLFHCSVCNAITAIDPCEICSDPRRDRTRICVVEEPFNIQPLERTGEYHGLYHVLLGALSPQRGIGPEELAVEGLFARLDGVEEVVLATNPNVEGEATALYLARRLAGRVPRLTRLAFGMPVGGDIEYTDEVTLGRSLAGRQEIG
ncbi:MAG: replication and repair protein RecR [Acidobacteria bacterium]|jgi:recombination protein RecR|nr:replication and repair protein RecR [Acidobacteriota bacterium]